MEVIKFFQTSGPFMYPILLVLAMGIAIAIERFLFLIKTQGYTRNWCGRGQVV